MSGRLFLIPNFLGEPSPDAVLLPATHHAEVKKLKEFIVENEKNARACLKALQIETQQSELVIHVLDKHNIKNGVPDFLKNAIAGGDIGLLSDAGTPCVADPGAEVVKVAHQKNVRVIPLVGASSILLALMASGFNGQSFAFHGYLPIESGERVKKLRQLEKDAKDRKQTQLFIETPYRNNQLLQDIIKSCLPQTLLCVACNLTLPDENITSKTVKDWKNMPYDYHKKPAVFVLFAY